MAHFRKSNDRLQIDATSVARRIDAVKLTDTVDEKMGFERFDSGEPRIGWLVNFQPTTLDLENASETEVINGKSAVDFYFLDEMGGYFKTAVQYDPYFFVQCYGREQEVDEYIKRKLENVLKSSVTLQKDDLSLPNHLQGSQTTLIKLTFWNVQDLQTAKRLLSPVVDSSRRKNHGNYVDISSLSVEQCILDLKEHDVPYHVRVSIDLDIRVGKWYEVQTTPHVKFTELEDRVERADPVVMAFDIETMKQPLKFPDSAYDAVMMISFMVDKQGFLIINRDFVSEDIEPFEYTPKPEYPGTFQIFNEPSEREVLERFFTQIKEERPTVIATFNGDGFDWPFIAARAALHGIDMYREIGFRVDSEGTFRSSYCAHMDCFRWVQRDSYLPQGSQGLKAVTKAKLGYDPAEVDPELMVPYARDRPKVMAEYSVSDAVATYYLYMKYVHPFIFSLCNIIPLRPDEVLRKGTGTLCEMLLMVQAYQRNILLPHKYTDPPERYYQGHLLESETYVGGHVESLESGVFRDDIPTQFNIEIDAVDELISQLDDALKFTITVENGKKLEDVEDYDKVKENIEKLLLALKDRPKRMEEPLIYHVDVASMYPNIMTTNRLQPDSMKSESDCAMCDYNVPGKTCDRRLPWSWRGEFSPATESDILMIRNKLRSERHSLELGTPAMAASPAAKKGYYNFDELPRSKQLDIERKRIAMYSAKAYHRTKVTETVEREAIICQRENPFYVNTVRDFRDRRYKYKGLQKLWKKNMSAAKDASDREYAARMIVLYDSMQLAHKCILNSFYGYVMRKGSRWYSMEMAGVTCLTGATIIQLARGMVERLGRPLELDTDGIWCILPKSFPGELDFKMKDGKSLNFSYPCIMLNHLVHKKFTNHQYQNWNPDKGDWETTSDNSIFFEVDGPYKAMMLPASLEEGKGLKKRYAVFDTDGSLVECKGFEMKRRGELQLIKNFQQELFGEYLGGNSLKSCYDGLALVANRFLDIIDYKGKTQEDVELMDLISENKVMSKSLKDYGAQKSTSICTARRIEEFLGSDMTKDSGLVCRYIISEKPANEPVTSRAVPVQIFQAPLAVKQKFLRKWLGDESLVDFDPRSIIAWDYYRERLGATIQKIIVIPAALQHVENPVPRVKPPKWLERRIDVEMDSKKQQKIGFTKISKAEAKLWGDGVNSNSSSDTLVDVEDIPGQCNSRLSPIERRGAVVYKRKANTESSADVCEDVSKECAPDPDRDYQMWLVYMKKVWKKQRLQFKIRHQMFGDSAAQRQSRGIHGIIRQQTEEAWKGGNIWRILQVCTAGDSGKVKIVAKVNNRLQSVFINVPRQLYVQLRQGHELPQLRNGIRAQPSDFITPSGHSSDMLYQVTMSENQYQEELFKSDGFFNDRSVEKVFESRISASERVLIQLGSTCQLDPNGRPGLLGKGLDSGFDLDWLQAVQPPKNKANDSGTTSNETLEIWKTLEYVFLKHTEVHGRHIIAIFNSWNSDVKILEYAARQTAGSSNWLNNLSSEYSAQLALHKPEQPIFSFSNTLEIEHFSKFDNLRKYWASVGKAVTDLLSQRSRNVVAAISCERGTQWLSSRVRTLNEIPQIGLSTEDGSSSPLPSIGWEEKLPKRIARAHLRSQHVLQRMCMISEHTNIPLSNIPSGEDFRSLFDIVFARRLIQSKHVLWWNDSLQNNQSGVTDISNQLNQSLATAGSTNELITKNSGIYANVCLDIRISRLVLNSILRSSDLMAAEGAESVDPEIIFDAFSPMAWRCLVNLTSSWFYQGCANDEAAQLCYSQLEGWIMSPSSRLWDAKLVHQINALSKKSLNQLCSELKKFGPNVIYCGSKGQRIILETSKKSAKEAAGFGGIVINQLKNCRRLNFLELEVDEVWDFLVWLNSENYCGRVISQSGCLTGTHGELEYVSQWQIADYLPLLLQEELSSWIDEFMGEIAEAKDSYLESARSTNSFQENANRTNTVSIIDDSSISMKIPSGSVNGVRQIPVEFMQGRLARLEKHLVNRVKQLKNRYLDDVARNQQQISFSMPQRAGTNVSERFESPILAYVKTLLTVLSAAKLDEEYIALRRNLLSIVDVGDFDNASEFKNPASKLIVHDVVCLGCMACVDVDVCCPQAESENKFYFQCPYCGVGLDRVYLEEKLVQMLVTAITCYQLQDLQCTKCNQMRPNNMAEYCSCSGQFKNTLTADSMAVNIDIYKHIGKYYDLRLLKDLISQY